jgi:hypothetical protein
VTAPALIVDPTGDHGSPLALCSACPPDVWGWADPENAGDAFAEHMRTAHPSPVLPNLPEPFGHPFGGLDVDALRTLAPQIRTGLVAELRHAAALAREARGTVVVPEDTYPLVRSLTAAEEVLLQWSSAFTAGAAEARAIVEEEALTVAGSEQDGVLTSSLFVPDGEGQRIAVRADYASGSSTWDVSTLVGWLIDDEVTNTVATLDEGEPLDRTDLAQVARGVVARLIGLDGMPGLGKFTPGAREVENLRKRLAEQQRDADAAVIRQVRTVGPRTYRGVKITREEAK